ncbi:MAG: FliI/YscN family ATPase [Nitrospinota bacterium]
MIDFELLETALQKTSSVRHMGKVLKMSEFIIEGNGPDVTVGSLCRIYPKGGHAPMKAEVVGFREDSILLMPFGNPVGVGPGCFIVADDEDPSVLVSEKLLGRVLDGSGNPLDDMPAIREGVRVPIFSEPLNPLKRQPIDTPLDLGVKAVNGFLTVGNGQRIGIVAGTGVGKSVLMGMIARNTDAEVCVIALIGERGKEVGDFIHKNLGEKGKSRSVVIAATSDQPPLIRMRGAAVATSIAEYFRGQGKNVLLMMDSLTRVAMAQREIGLAIGEPPTTKGYPPSVFSVLPKLLERAGRGEGRGSITGLYSVLVEGDDLNEPVSDTARAILDGHIVLSRELAAKNHYPAIDIMESISRVMIDVASEEQVLDAGKLKEIIATYNEAQDLINIGAYVSGSNPKIDTAIRMIGPINSFLRQGIFEKVDLNSSKQLLRELAGQSGI